MNIESLRAFALSMPYAVEDVKWEADLTFCIGGKMFAITGLEGPFHVTIKCTPESFAELTEKEGIKPSPYLARYFWLSVSERALPDRELKELIKQSYELVWNKLPKREKEKLQGVSKPAIRKPRKK